MKLPDGFWDYEPEVMKNYDVSLGDLIYEYYYSVTNTRDHANKLTNMYIEKIKRALENGDIRS